jgi:hypothetical protein
MASTDQDLRHKLGDEREQLVDAVETLRGEIGHATAVVGKVRAKLPVAAAGALGLGFVASGGMRAMLRMVTRRGRKDEPKARDGRRRRSWLR